MIVDIIIGVCLGLLLAPSGILLGMFLIDIILGVKDE